MNLHTVYSLACGCSVALSSCCVPNLSGVADAVGRDQLVFTENEGSPCDLAVYKLGGAYYVEVQASWQHVPARCFYLYDPFQGDTGGIKVWQEYDDEAPLKTFLVRLDADAVKDLLQKRVPEPPKDSARLIPQNQFDYARAERCMVRPVLMPRYNSTKPGYGRAWEYYSTSGCKLKHRAWYNYAMQPVSWALWAVDVPLAVALNGTFYLVFAPVFATQEVMIQSFGYEPWAEDEPAPLPVVRENTAQP